MWVDYSVSIDSRQSLLHNWVNMHLLLTLKWMKIRRINGCWVLSPKRCFPSRSKSGMQPNELILKKLFISQWCQIIEKSTKSEVSDQNVLVSLHIALKLCVLELLLSAAPMLSHMTCFTYNYCPSLHLKELKYRLLLHLWYQMFVEENCCWVQESLRTLNWMLLFSKHQIWQNLHRRIVKNVIQTWQWLEILKSDKWKTSEENNKFSVNILVEWKFFNSIASEKIWLNCFYIL